MPDASTSRRALLVDDEPDIRDFLCLHLRHAGFDVHEAGDGRTALQLARNQVFQLLVLDVMLPALDGVSLCKAVRAAGPNAESPILMLTARNSEADKVIGLESGADDYLTKPFGVREFLARVHALVRRHARNGSRAESAAVETAASGRVQLDAHRRVVHVCGRSVDLTRQEFDLLHRLATRPGIVFSRAVLLQHVWSEDQYVTERTVDTVISRLRRKLERDPRDPELLLTAWGVGYKFVRNE